MQTSTIDLSGLGGPGSDETIDTVPRPRSRWKTRVALPLAIFGTAVSLLAYSARGALSPAVGVWVVPVIAKAMDVHSTTRPNTTARVRSDNDLGPLLVQAPGWVEAAPYAVNVPALAEGVIKDVLVLEGDRVEIGQVIARMVDDDARLAVRGAEADLAAMKAEVSKAEIDSETANVRAAELSERLKRTRDLAKGGGIPMGEFAQLEFRLQAAESDTKGAKTIIEVKKANVTRQEVVLDEARLHLSRMEIRSPSAGIVLSRQIEPGLRISMSSRSRPGAAPGTESMSGTVVRLYDPDKLQVRTEIPLADSAKVEIGGRAQITSEALPERTLLGTVTRVVHEANIQRNTVQVKVSIDHPVPALKPEMLARVKIYAAPPSASGSQESSVPESGSPPSGAQADSADAAQPGVRLTISVAALVNREVHSAQAWAVNKLESGETEAELRTVSLAGESSDGNIEVLKGVRLGDRLVADAPIGLSNGDRIRILGEKSVGSKSEDAR